ncbi:hypothetical protein SAMN05216337_1007196 [Bradyrhizobium brasilense]|uniref:Uncharacterized protein n=1 Tax=Bradyrhizobium brasilense TaxID=1419277 RepID=A0A1G6RZL8_9BRAD|nr:hypothetical protein SAMN05216337_1007196 [Bradyrhizobium brasilense]
MIGARAPFEGRGDALAAPDGQRAVRINGFKQRQI